MQSDDMKILPTAFRVARWMAWTGFVCGVAYSFGGLVVDLFTIGLNWGTALAFMALVLMPVISATLGFLVGALFALVVRCVDAVLRRVGRGQS